MIKLLWRISFKLSHNCERKFFNKFCGWLQEKFCNYSIFGGIDKYDYIDIPSIIPKWDDTDEYITKKELEEFFTHMLDLYYGRIVWRKLSKKESIVQDTLLMTYKLLLDYKSHWHKS
jgi:hypothetical protein